MNKITKRWMLLKDAIANGKVTKRQVYGNTQSGVWKDGYVVKKNGAGTRWMYFCEEDFNKCENLENCQVA